MSSGPKFEMELGDGKELAWDRLQENAPELGVTFIGNVREGRFFGNGIVGHYAIRQNSLTITITVMDFPASEIYTEKAIKDALKKLFASALENG
ncbi:MAG: hypothetical protein PHH61_00040 [Candidatus Nanoarchaeia archaeon]|nr:hypothetical protein [Candidatus Nanoarchaeia archaeon]